MSNLYVLYSITSQGYVSKTGNYTSDWKSAKTFEHGPAMDLARRHKSQAGYKMIPVLLEDLQAL